MPRQPRLDVPGLLHHVIARGIDHPGELVPAAGARVFAWS